VTVLLLSGISVLICRPTSNVYLTASAYNAPSHFWVPGYFPWPARGQSYGFQESQSPQLLLLRPTSSDTFPSPSSLVTEICSGLRFAYPSGDGSAAIRCSIAPKRRRVRWLSASSNQ